MSAIAYMRRAVNRAVTRGPVDTLRYSFHVARNAILSAYIDIMYGGSLSRDRLHINDGRPNCNPLMHTEWRVLRAIFDQIEIKPDDVIVDIGCGDGRVINYWLSRGLKNRMIGIEIDPPTAEATRMRYRAHANVEIIFGDASQPPGGTLYYVYNSFVGESLERFAESLKGRDATIVLYNFTDLRPFSDWKTMFLESRLDELQYRCAVLRPPGS